MRGRYIGRDPLVSLKVEEDYYLFPNGPDYYYVSRFPNERAHTGCYERHLFKTFIETEGVEKEPEQKAIKLDKEKMYSARLIWRREGYSSTELKTYYIKPLNTHCYFYEDAKLTKFIGCFPMHWFDEFSEVDEKGIHIIEETSSKRADKVEGIMENAEECQQLSLF